ncbi:hypothetical protein D3228_01950 [Leucobacter luti]|nr:hypothetical protein [Leucobacter luti]
MFASTSFPARSASATHSTASMPRFALTCGSSAVRSHSVLATTSGPGAVGSICSTTLKLTPFALLSRSEARYTKPSFAAVMPSVSGPAAPGFPASFANRARLPAAQPSANVAVPSAATSSFQNRPSPLSTAHSTTPSAVTSVSRPELSSRNIWVVSTAVAAAGPGHTLVSSGGCSTPPPSSVAHWFAAPGVGWASTNGPVPGWQRASVAFAASPSIIA